MVNLGRADYYIENIAGMLSISPGLLKTPEQGFTSKVLFSKGFFSYFQDTKQGEKLAVIFNRELLALYQRGEYGTLFYTQAPFYLGSDTVDDAVDFINKTNPELKIPQQPSGRTIIENNQHLP